jgi:lipid II:glycine glycyltransferase (peptidoglycan interpeptide bridge formation enzyme)
VAALVERDRGRLYVAVQDGRIVGGTLFATFADRAYLVHTGATDAGREEGAPFLVLFTALTELREAGFVHINLGGAAPDAEKPESPDHGLHQFKTRFGAEREERTSGTIALHPMRARVVEATRRLVRR